MSRLPSIPQPRLEVVENLTPFVHFKCQKMGAGRRFYDTVVVKGTFLLNPGLLKTAEEQAPIVLADRYWSSGDASLSSLSHAGEVLLGKPETDVLVTGAARAPGGRPLAEWDCAVVVRGAQGTLLSHALQVTGPRRFMFRALHGWSLSDPEPTTDVPIRYELAYGGSYVDPRSGPNKPRVIVHKANPSGVGVFNKDGLDTSRSYPGPQWQLRARPVTAMNSEVPLAGLGPIARMWSSRLTYAGTYDQAWEERLRADVASGLVPDYPSDFDPRFFQCAHPALIAREPLRGDEHVGLLGLLPSSNEFVFQLPAIRLRASVRGDTTPWEDRAMSLDTVHVDLDAARVYLCWRIALDNERNLRAAVIVVDRGEKNG